MDPTGLLYDIFAAAYHIKEGRKGFTIPGGEPEGRIFYEDGIALALATFQEARRGADLRILILIEAAFLNHELQFCDAADTDTRNSLNRAIQGFMDSMRALEVVEDAAGYKVAKKTYPTDPKKRVEGFPMDVFHQTCSSHQTRLRNVLCAPGINMREKALLKQRAANMKIVRGAYVEKQRKALAGEE